MKSHCPHHISPSLKFVDIPFLPALLTQSNTSVVLRDFTQNSQQWGCVPLSWAEWDLFDEAQIPVLIVVLENFVLCLYCQWPGMDTDKAHFEQSLWNTMN